MARSLEEWLAYQSQVHPQTIDLGLERMQRVLERLGWRQPSVPVITVAGTNGKGSVSTICASVLGAAGYRVGTFTSPHLRDYRERIRVVDRLATAQELVAAFERIEAACAGNVSLTFFEYNALAAFLVFDGAALDAWVLEVGLGGRLDAVNVVDASVAVVVSIGFDHQDYLGNTLEAIAREKAGIFRSGRPAVLGSRDLPQSLIDSAVVQGAIPKQLGSQFDYSQGRSEWSYRGSRWNLANLPPPALGGVMQIANAATALAALEELDRRLPITAQAVAVGLSAVRLVGRFQVLESAAARPRWILDVAHNPDAARVLSQNLQALPASGRTLAVCGILADKDAPAIALVLRDCFAEWWLAPTDGARGTTALELRARIGSHLRVPLRLADDIATACAGAAAAAGPSDRIVVFGSFHTVGPALDWLESQCLLPASALPEYTDAPRQP